MKTIFSSPEYKAWAKDFKYQDYLNLLTWGYAGKAVSSDMYTALCKVFEKHMIKEMQNEN